MTTVTRMPQTKDNMIPSSTDDFLQSITFQTCNKYTEEDDVMEKKDISKSKSTIRTKLKLGVSSSNVNKHCHKSSNRSTPNNISKSSINLSSSSSMPSMTNKKNVIGILSRNLSGSMKTKMTTKPSAPGERIGRGRVLMGTRMLRGQ